MRIQIKFKDASHRYAAKYEDAQVVSAWVAGGKLGVKPKAHKTDYIDLVDILLVEVG